MSTPGKILWSEGLFLRPQHFQQQDLYHELRVQQMAASLHPYAWGVRAVTVHADSLRDNVLSLDELSLVFRDGEIVRAPLPDALPHPLRLAEVPATITEVVVHAVLPRLKPQGQNADGAEARYTCESRSVQDLYTEATDAPAPNLRPQVRLVTHLEPLEGYESIPLVRLRRLSTGGWEQDRDYIPPSMSIAGAGSLHLKLTRLMEKLLAKVHALYGHHREPSRNVVELRGTDVSSFWLLHTASAGYAALLHELHNPGLHPERLFQTMLGVAGGLMAYSRSYKLEDLPKYEHEKAGESFAKLDAIIRELLDTVISARYFAIALSSEKPGYHTGALDSGRIDAATTLYLAVGADMPALELVEIVPLRFKVGAPDDVDKLVLSALPGIRLRHAPQVPSAVPVRPETCYFTIENKGNLYEAMLKAQAISIYVPNGIRDLQLELIAVAS
ncbi:type VI secretion system baseplate subunit TssK [Massilia arenosa]|uniref:Type VI secretion system baseplate subunit TssK n=1 Tax=Zemynaea arenosa TaxID=2561931 RepID=A0A4Y9SM71_9BURK|nr:type VI secretion system baseplate subunit TssK [Massilia arenosa]TFW23165.1 type VI secretion system baseplate subunit TssK [Massilia arenosa]